LSLDAGSAKALLAPSNARTDLGLTLPIFLCYHLGVIFLPVRNAADLVTQYLVELAHQSRVAYLAFTIGIGAAFVAVLVLLGRREVLRWQSFLWLALEGVLYALAMRLVAGAVVGRLFLAAGIDGQFTGLVMSLGAGLYEELAFRVVLFGLGLRCLRILWPSKAWWRRALLGAGWACASAMTFSAWHHLGALGEEFDARVFVFRAVCGLIFTVIYVTRGFAPVVWTHVLYDVWVLVMSPG
jgi:hypothetical protein